MCVCGETEAVNKVLDELGLSLDAQVSGAKRRERASMLGMCAYICVCVYVCGVGGDCEQGLG